MHTPARVPAPAVGRYARSAALVTTSQLSMAGGGYLVLVLAGRPLDPAAFAALTAFYLLINTVGRGLCSATELHLTRAVAADLALGRPLGSARRAGARQAFMLLVLALVATALAAPFLHTAFGGSWTMVLMLASSLPGMAWVYRQRGLLAGTASYGRFSLSFAAEGVTSLLLGVVVLASGSTDATMWALCFTLGPTVSVAVLAVLGGRRPERGAAGVGGATAARAGTALGWSVLILGGSQAVWNLPPVILTARLGHTPATAAAFAALAVVLRIPVLLFPSLQALLLPALTHRSAATSSYLSRVRGTVVGAAALGVAVWLLISALLAPVAVTVVFGLQHRPGGLVALVLAAATVAGGLAVLGQTALVALGEFARPGLAWLAALAVVVLVGVLAPAEDLVAALSLLAATVLVAALLVRELVLRFGNKVTP